MRWIVWSAALIALTGLAHVAPARAQQAGPGVADGEGTAAAAAPDGRPETIRLAILPFRVNAGRGGFALLRPFEELLGERLAALEDVDVVGLAGAAPLPSAEEIASLEDEALRRIAEQTGASAVVSGSLTELAGRISLDVRVTPARAGAPARSAVFTAASVEDLLARLDQIASRVSATFSAEESLLVAEIQIDAPPELEAALRAALASKIGEPFDAARLRDDRARLEALPRVGSVSIETVRGESGVVLRYRVVPTELLLGGGAALPTGERVAEIRVQGNRRIEADAIRTRIRTRAGEPLRRPQLAADIREIFGLGFFRNVLVYADETPDGLVLTFDVEENPVIRQISISGNDNVDSEDIRDALTLTTGSTLDYPLLHENKARIEALYRADGYYLAKVSFKIDALSEGSVGVVYEVDEREKLKLREIAFEGNSAFTDAELRDGLNVKTWKFWSYATSWFDKSGTYSEPIFVRDLREIEKKYTDAGYLQVELGEPAVDASEDGLRVAVGVFEGPRFSVGEIDVAGDETVDIEALREKLQLDEGEVFNRSHLTEDVEALERYYTDRGFYFARVEPRTRLDAETRQVDVRFQVEKGPLYFVRHIEIGGNTRTVDPVIRREMKVVEGQLYSARAIQVSNVRARQLGFFEDVSFEPRTTDDPALLDLDVNIVERPTGSFSFGAGFSSQDKLVLTASLSQANLFGRGYGVNLSADIGGRTNRFFFSFSDPYFLDSTFSLSTTVFLTDIRFEDFEQQQTGFDISLGHALSEDNRARAFLRYSFSRREVRQNSSVNAAAVIFREILQGNESSSIVGASVRSDTRNDQFAPTSGDVWSGTLEYAGLGGFANFLRIEGRYSKYFGAPRWLLDHSTFVLTTRAGYVVPFNSLGDFDFTIDDDTRCVMPGSCDGVASLSQIDRDIKLPLTERYFLGGVGTFQLRGFRARSVGPRRPILRRDNLGGTGTLFLPVGTQLQPFGTRSGAGFFADCNDVRDPSFGNPNQGNGNDICNELTDRDIDDFDDLSETDVIGGNSFIATSLEYRFPISEEVGLQGVFFADMGNAFQEGDNLFDVTEWRYGFGGGVLWFSPFGPLQVVLGFPIDPLSVENSPVFEFSVGGAGL